MVLKNLPKSKVPKSVAIGLGKQGEALPVSTASKKKRASRVLPKVAEKKKFITIDRLEEVLDEKLTKPSVATEIDPFET